MFVSKKDVKVWDSGAKFCLELDVSGLELFPDFGHLLDFGAEFDEEAFFWRDDGLALLEKKAKGGDKAAKAVLDWVLWQLDDCTCEFDDFTWRESWDLLGTACIDGDKLAWDKMVVQVKSKGGKDAALAESNAKYGPKYDASRYEDQSGWIIEVDPPDAEEYKQDLYKLSLSRSKEDYGNIQYVLGKLAGEPSKHEHDVFVVDAWNNVAIAGVRYVAFTPTIGHAMAVVSCVKGAGKMLLQHIARKILKDGFVLYPINSKVGSYYKKACGFEDIGRTSDGQNALATLSTPECLKQLALEGSLEGLSDREIEQVGAELKQRR